MEKIKLKQIKNDSNEKKEKKGKEDEDKNLSKIALLLCSAEKEAFQKQSVNVGFAWEKN